MFRPALLFYSNSPDLPSPAFRAFMWVRFFNPRCRRGMKACPFDADRHLGGFRYFLDPLRRGAHFDIAPRFPSVRLLPGIAHFALTSWGDSIPCKGAFGLGRTPQGFPALSMRCLRDSITTRLQPTYHA